MTVLKLHVRDAAELVRDQEQGLAAWLRETDERLALDPESVVDREAQMDARRHLAGLERTRAAVLEWQARPERGAAVPADAVRAVVVLRDEWMRARICEELSGLGISVVGQGEDGAMAVAMVVVEQPELLVIEDRLPWVTPLDVVSEARRFAPRTVVAVQLGDGDEAASLLAAGAAAVVARTASLSDLCVCCTDALRSAA